MITYIRKGLITVISVGLIVQFSCSQKKSVRYIKKPIPRNAGVAIIVDTPQKIKNVILARFLTSGFNVKAVAAADMYANRDVFDIRDMKRVVKKSSGELALVSMEKTYNNIYKLHLYNFEINKAEMLDEIRRKWNVQYLVLMDLRDWEKVSWARAIDLGSYEIIWLENYPTKYADNVESVIDYFIKSMTNTLPKETPKRKKGK